MAASKKTTLLIIDGHAVLHRAWHALPPLATKDGRIVSGAYGFITTLLKAIREFQPTHVAVTFDVDGGTFRHEEYKEYKGKRQEQPEELYQQVPVIEEILGVMHIPVFTKKGFEADDVIGTITRLAKEQNKDVTSIIATGDMDTLQLVDDRTKVFTMRKGFSDTVVYDERAVMERFGLQPRQLIEYKALRGDPSDNIPGVRGVGEKTASQLIRDFGSVAALYEAIDKGEKKAETLTKGILQKLTDDRKNAELAHRLVTIHRDVPISFSLEQCVYEPVAREVLEPLFTDLQFTRLLQQIPEKKPVTTTGGAAPQEATASLFGAGEATTPVVSPLLTIEDLERDLRKVFSAKEVAFRSLTRQDDPLLPDIIAFAFSSHETTVLLDTNGLEQLRGIVAESLSGHGGTLVVHDLKRELNVLRSAGIVPGGHPFDLMIASYLLHSGDRRSSLDAMLAFHRNVAAPGKMTTDEERTARLRTEVGYFVSLAAELGKELETHRLKELNEEMELPLAPVLARMERVGIAIDPKHFAALSKKLAKRIDSLTSDITAAAGTEFNINSPAQLRDVLFNRLKIMPRGLKKTEKSGTISTAAGELEKLKEDHPIIRLILEYRELAKLQSTYVDAIPPLAHAVTKRIHASFNQTVAATGRLSSSDPNMQNIPSTDTEHGKQVRNGFVASKGYTLLAADYSQVELRIAAHIAKEKKMIDAFRKGEDIHWRTAVEMFGEEQAKEKRRIAKVINFGILYGMGASSLAIAADIPFADARDYIERYFANYQGIATYMAEMAERIAKVGHVETLFGRKRFFPNFDVMNRREQAEAERQAINMPIQGTNADMIKTAMIRIDQHITKTYGAGDDVPVRMLLQVHDELVFEVKPEVLETFADVLVPLMADTIDLSVPIVVNLSKGARWGELEKIA